MRKSLVRSTARKSMEKYGMAAIICGCCDRVHSCPVGEEASAARWAVRVSRLGVVVHKMVPPPEGKQVVMLMCRGPGGACLHDGKQPTARAAL